MSNLLARITARVSEIAVRFAADCPGVSEMPTLRQLKLIEDMLEYAEKELGEKEARP